VSISEDPARDNISPAAQAALRAAIQRLLSGRPTCTDGRLIKENLYKEAGISRASMNRASGILAEWDQATAATGSRTASEARRDDRISDLEIQTRNLKQERTLLQQRLDAAATVITALYIENAALREQTVAHETVVGIDSWRGSRTQALDKVGVSERSE
jgi:hypothetical protein